MSTTFGAIIVKRASFLGHLVVDTTDSGGVDGLSEASKTASNLSSRVPMFNHEDTASTGCGGGIRHCKGQARVERRDVVKLARDLETNAGRMRRIVDASNMSTRVIT